ncbi:MAG: 4Fe-4S binding protein [Anaerolineae bacterium]
MVWSDADRCTGCGACVDVCRVGAIALVDGRARIDEQTCTGCEACIGVCPEEAIQPVVQGELVPAEERRPAPAVQQRAPAVQRARPLAETAGTAVAVAGAGLLARGFGALARAVERWLMEPSTGTGPSAAGERTSRVEGGRAAGRGRRRRRRRGGAESLRR